MTDTRSTPARRPTKKRGLHIRYGWAILDRDGSYAESPTGNVLVYFHRTQAVMSMQHNGQRIVKARVVSNGRRA